VTDPLAARFASALEPVDPDWDDVRRRVRRRRRPLILAAAAVAVLVAVPAVAFAVDPGAMPWSSAEPSPRAAASSVAGIVSTRNHALATVPGVTPIAPGETRRVDLGGGAVADVTPTSDGGFCAEVNAPGATPQPVCVEALERARFGGRPLVNFAVNGVGSPDRNPFHMDGYVLAPAGSSLRLVFRDGSSRTIPVTWIGPPVSAGLFATTVQPSPRMAAFVLREPDGTTVRRDLAWWYRGIAHAVPPGG